jgi:hypothetical protein
MFSHMVLDVLRSSLHKLILEISGEVGQVLPCPLHSYVAQRESGEQAYGPMTEDPYGDPLMYVLASHLKPLASKVNVHARIQHPKNPERPTAWQRIGSGKALTGSTRKRKPPRVDLNIVESPEFGITQATFAFICALPDDFKIVLYWH